MTSLLKNAMELERWTIEDVKKIFDPNTETEELENLDQEGYDELLKLREKFLGEDIFKEGSFGKSFYDAIIKSPNYSLDKVKFVVYKLVKSLIDLNKKIKGELDDIKRRFWEMYSFERGKKVIWKAIAQKNEKEGLNLRSLSYTGSILYEIETQKKRLNDDITTLEAEKKTLVVAKLL